MFRQSRMFCTHFVVADWRVTMKLTGIFLLLMLWSCESARIAGELRLLIGSQLLSYQLEFYGLSLPRFIHIYFPFTSFLKKLVIYFMLP